MEASIRTGGWLALAALLAPVSSPAPVAAIHSLRQLAQAPALVVARVESVEQGPKSLTDQRAGRESVYDHVAHVQVLRFAAEDDSELREYLQSAARIAVAYRSYQGRGISMAGPHRPELQENDVRLLPLRFSGGDYSRPELFLESGSGLVIPAHDELLVAGEAADRLSFALREVANALVFGTPADAHGAARYLVNGLNGGTWPPDGGDTDALFAFVSPALASDPQRAADAAAALFSAQGIPRPSPEDQLRNLSEGGIQRLSGQVYGLLPEAQRERLLIEALIRNLSDYRWGVATTLPAFVDYPIVTGLMREALTARRDGALYVAALLIRAGARDLIPVALPMAKEIVETSTGEDSNQLHQAAWLIAGEGSDEDFEVLTETTAKAQASEPEIFRRFWGVLGYVHAGSQRRRLEVLSVFLTDERIVFDDFRYSDLAAAQVRVLRDPESGLGTPLKDYTAARRDRLVEDARAWVAEQLTSP